jgi:hypothetical protein
LSWGDPASELLDRLQKRRDKVRTLYHVTRTRARDGAATRETTTQIWEKQFDKMRKSRWVAEAKMHKKDPGQGRKEKTLTVSDGKHEWRELLVGGKIMVFKARVSETEPLDEVRRALHSGNSRMKGSESIHGEACVVLNVTGGGRRDRLDATYWISEAYGVVLKSVITKADRTRTEMDTVEFKVNAPIEDEKFSYEPPDDATVLDTDTFGRTGGGGKP